MAITFDGEKDKLQNWEVYLLEFERQETTLEADITAASTAVSAADVGDFPNQGYIRIGDEILYYGTKTGDTPGCFESVRGVFESVAASAASGDAVIEAFDKYWATKTNLISGGLDLSNDRAILNFPKGLKATIEPDEGKSDIGGITISMVDSNKIASQLLSTIPMRNRMATLWAGYENLPASAFEKEFVGVVKSWNLTNKMRDYSLSIADLKRTYREGIFTQFGKCKNTALINAGVTTFNVTSTDAASAGDRKFTDPACGYDVKPYIHIEDEILGPVTSKTATSFTVTARGVFDTQAATHSASSDISECFCLDARNPITMLLQILTSTGATGSNGSYDVLPEHMGFGIDEDLIDVDTFETERDDWTSTYNLSFSLLEQVTGGKEWLESEILRVIGGYIITLRDGRLSLRMYHRQALADSQILTTDDIIGDPSWNPSLPSIINQLQVFYSKSPHDGTYREIYWEINADSISKHGASPMMDVAFDGVHGDWSLLDPLLDGSALVKDYASRILTRYADPAPTISLKLKHSHRQINVGDLIAVTHNDFPNLAPASGDPLTGRGVQLEEYEVVGRKTVYKDKESYIDVDAQRAIYAEGAAKYVDYFYRQYNYNYYFTMPHNSQTGNAINWIANKRTLTANKIRIRALMSRNSGATEFVLGRLKTDIGNIINSATVPVSQIAIYPNKSWHTFEFTIGAEVGEDIEWVGINRHPFGILLGLVYLHTLFYGYYPPIPDEYPDTQWLYYNSSSGATITTSTDYDITADVSELLV